MATSRALVLAAAIAAASSFRTEVSFSMGIPRLSQSTPNTCVSRFAARQQLPRRPNFRRAGTAADLEDTLELAEENQNTILEGVLELADGRVKAAAKGFLKILAVTMGDLNEHADDA